MRNKSFKEFNSTLTKRNGKLVLVSEAHGRTMEKGIGASSISYTRGPRLAQ